MQLEDRKKKILQAIIDAYIDTAEPVGSRTLSKNYNLGLSPATIRNEMMDLEEMGYLEQPHTSAGRVPSHKGYRFYVDSLMKRYRLSVSEMEDMNRAMKARFSEFNEMLDYAGRVISNFTNYTTIAAAPKIHSVVIRKLDIVEVDSTTVLAVILTDGGVIKNKLIKLKTPAETEDIAIVKQVLSGGISGKGKRDISKEYINSINHGLSAYSELTVPILGFVLEVLEESDSQEDIFLSGIRRILDHPEFSNIDKAREFLEALEDKERIVNILSNIEGTKAPTVLIGQEIGTDYLKDTSFVVCHYSAGEGNTGLFGIIGPTRMDYARVLSNLEYFVKNFNKKLLEDKQESD